ncbi:MAG: response regulator [Myxococcota bacterium]
MAEAEQHDAAQAGSTPTFGVRFESRDDFLVEYTDSLRHGRIRLPVEPPLQPGTLVRLKVCLPDDAVLYLRGAVEADPGRPDGTTVGLEALTPAQREALESCVDGVVGHTEEATTSPYALGPEGDPLQVLVVDDSVSHRIELGDVLRARGMRVRVAENGLLGLSAALKKVPDVILTDVEMPQMDGWSLLRSVRQRKRLRGVPVVFLTRLSDELSRLRGYRMGADDFLPKDMAPDEIAARLLGAVTRRRQLPAIPDAQGLRGELEHVRLGSLLAFLESERRSGSLHLRHGADAATLHLRNGALARVEQLGTNAHPHDRVFELLGWARGEFDFQAVGGTEGEPLPGPANDGAVTALSYLLMEHARREDERNST